MRKFRGHDVAFVCSFCGVDSISITSSSTVFLSLGLFFSSLLIFSSTTREKFHHFYSGTCILYRLIVCTMYLSLWKEEIRDKSGLQVAKSYST